MEIRFKKPLSGIIPPLVTPLRDNETLDVESLERLIEHLIAGGVHGLFVLGTTGEEQSLSYEMRKQMIRESCRINRGRLPLLACVTDTSIVESIHLANCCRLWSGWSGVCTSILFCYGTTRVGTIL